jgi:death-on-curing protein
VTTKYLTVDQLIAINASQDGGVGVQNLAGVEQNAGRPQSGFGGYETFPDLWAKAAAYAHGIASTQYFTDGNKRTGWFAAVTFLRLNGVPFPDVSDVEAEVFVQAISQNIFDTEDEPDRTIAVATEWFTVRSSVRHTSAYVLDPRLEFCFLAYTASVDASGGIFQAFDAGLGAVAVPEFPYPVQLSIVGRIHWNRVDLGRDHRVGAKFVQISGKKRINRSRTDEPLGVSLIESDRWHHPSGVLPTVFVLTVDPVFVGPGENKVVVTIDGRPVAELPFDVTHRPDLSSSAIESFMSSLDR